jgi:hypothetical protein
MDNDIAGQPQALQKSGRPVSSVLKYLTLFSRSVCVAQLMLSRLNLSTNMYLSVSSNLFEQD